MKEWPEGFDLEALLAPIPGDAPAGTDLRQDYSPDSPYYRLRDARAEARAAERAMDENGSEAGYPTQWRTVRDIATEAISSRTKDLEIAAWLTEALLRSDGLIGLVPGFRLMTGIAERFWDDFFPQPDEDGLAGRLAPVAGLNGIGGEGSLIQPLRRIVLFPRPDGAPLEFWEYLRSAEVAGIGDAERRQQRLDSGVLPFDVVQNEARAAGSALFEALRARAAEATEAWRELAQVFDSRAGADSPPTSRILGLLEQIGEVAKTFVTPETGAPEERSSLSDQGTELAVTAPAPGGIGSREEALRALAQIADFFRRTEPLSPITYTLQEAVRRSRMTWPELLEEIVPDPASRSAILSSLGIRPPPSE
jgi:type VI secretion system protein ImpA